MTTTTITSTEQAILTASQANGGGTFARSGQPATTGIAVTAEVVATVDALSEDAIAEAIDLVQAGEHLGTWHDEENGVWEISRTWVYPQILREGAFQTAAEWGERYVYDLDHDECLAVPSMSTTSN